MPLLQESTVNRDILSSRDGLKSESDQTSTPLKNPLAQVAFPGFTNAAMFTPSQLLMASQIMAASGLTLPPNPAFFHPTLFAAAATAAAATSPWSASSPPSPPSSSTEQLSPAIMKARKHNINNNIVTSSSNTNGGGIIEQAKMALPKRKVSKRIKLDDDIPLASPTSSSASPSPPGSLETRDAHRDKQFTCGVCNRSFGYKHVLQNHERTHTGEKPFECPECHKKFTRDHHLKTHMRLHTGERPYHCEHCDRQFVQVANLRRHLRVHTGERPYACEHCSAKFSDSNQLKAHVLIHTNEKPFSCERCQARFRRRHHLIHHKCSQQTISLLKKELLTSPVSEPEEDVRQQRRVLRAPLVSLPTFIAIPEQTEPEDLSMSTGLNSHSSSGDSPLSRSPSSREDPYEEKDFDMVESKMFLQQRRGSRSSAVHS